MASEKEKRHKLASLLRGAYYGGIEKPANVLAASAIAGIGNTPLASVLGLPELDFKEALESANRISNEGTGIQLAPAANSYRESNPGYFGAGEIGGGVATTLAPASLATRGIGAVAPAVSKAPLIGKYLSNLTSSVGAGTGLTGTLGQGAIQGAVSSGITDADPASGAIWGLGGNALGAIGSRLVKPVQQASTAARDGFVDTLKRAGIDNLSIGQLTGNKGFQTLESVLGNLPFTAGKAAENSDNQLRQFTQAAMLKAGIMADDFGPATREAAENNFKRRYGDLINNETVNIDKNVTDKVADIYLNQVEKLPTNVKPVVQSYLKDIVQSGGKLSGEAYQTARSQLTSQARAMGNSDPFTAAVLRDIRGTLDSAAERSLPEAKKGAWRDVNREYANYKTLQKAGSRVSENSLEGLISPAALLQSVENANKGKSQAGYGELYDLARAGRSVLGNAVPDSGTAQRALYQQLATGGAFGGAAGIGTLASGGDVDTAAQNALLTMGGLYAVPKALQKGLSSDAAKTYFTTGIPAVSRLVGQTGAIGPAMSAQSSVNGNSYVPSISQNPKDDFSDITNYLNQQQQNLVPKNDGFDDMRLYLQQGAI